MKNLRAVIVAASIAFCCASSNATAGSMRCKLTQVFELNDMGVPIQNTLADAYQETDLVVDLVTGTIYHSGFGNEWYPIKTILDAGSRSSAFKLISSSVPGPASDFDRAIFVNTIFLQIDTSALGPEKPFVVVESRNIGTGLCQ